MGQNSILEKFYHKLYSSFGKQYWWPGQTRLEVIVGAILTQNTNWLNVEKAIKNLKREKVLTLKALEVVPPRKLARLIKPSGYFNMKAKRLKNFISFINEEYQGRLDKMAVEPIKTLRSKILSVNGIGPETADSILLYALDKPLFVVDTYTKRLLYRHNVIPDNIDYHEIQSLFMKAMKPSVKRYNEYHALIVHLGKNFCKTKPDCEHCPLHQIHYSLKKRCSTCFRYTPKSISGLKRCGYCS